MFIWLLSVNKKNPIPLKSLQVLYSEIVEKQVDMELKH